MASGEHELMSSLSEIVDLEHQIHERRKTIEAAESELRKVHKEIERASDSLEEAVGKVNYHTNNLKYMKTKADVVDLEEYTKTMQHLRDAKESLVEAKFDMNKATTR